MQIINASVTSEAADGCTFRNSEATLAPKNWASKRILNATRRDHGEDREHEGRPSEPYGVGWIVNSPVERSVMV